MHQLVKTTIKKAYSGLIFKISNKKVIIVCNVYVRLLHGVNGNASLPSNPLGHLHRAHAPQRIWDNSS